MPTEGPAKPMGRRPSHHVIEHVASHRPSTGGQPSRGSFFHYALRQEVKDGSGECCRVTTGSIMVDILKNDLLSPRHTLGDRLADQRVPSRVLSPRITSVGRVKSFSMSHVMAGGGGAARSSGTTRALSSSTVCKSSGKLSNSPGRSWNTASCTNFAVFMKSLVWPRQHTNLASWPDLRAPSCPQGSLRATQR